MERATSLKSQAHAWRVQLCGRSGVLEIEAMWGESEINPDGELKVSFGYQWNTSPPHKFSERSDIPSGLNIPRTSNNISKTSNIPRTSSFSGLSGAALSANTTLANTNICNGLLGEEILPTWDSPKSFRRVPSSPSVSRLDVLCSSLQSNFSNLSCSPSSETEDYDSILSKSVSVPSRSDSFLNVMELQVAGGAAGEDRVQAVCSEEHGWLFCGIYDGFNGRDAADFLAGTLYETFMFHFNLWNSKKDLQYNLEDDNVTSLPGSDDLFRQGVSDSLQQALNQAESDYLYMVEQEMEERPDLVSVGSCVLIVLIHEDDLYTLNLGDSRAVLATYGEGSGNEGLKGVQLTESHNVDNEIERARLVSEHPDDPMTIVAEKVKGKLKVTRAFGVGYLKKRILNDALMGILRVRNLISPPYVSTQPFMNVHRISKSDQYVIVASDGLFDFISNEEVVKLVHSYITRNPSGDPAMFLVEQLVTRAADYAGLSWEELMNIPPGRRRKYHDDVTVIVVILGANHRTSKASTFE